MHTALFFSVIVVICIFIQSLSLFGQHLDSLLTNKRVCNAVSIGDLPLPRIDGVMDDEPDLILVPHHAWNGHMTPQAGRVHISPCRIWWEIFLQAEGTMFSCLN